jgi:hypothetical protein
VKIDLRIIPDHQQRYYLRPESVAGSVWLRVNTVPDEWTGKQRAIVTLARCLELSERAMQHGFQLAGQAAA